MSGVLIQHQQFDRIASSRLARLARWGDTSPDERFWAKVDASGDCWEWTGARAKNGYGTFTAAKPNVISAHRYAWESLVGFIPPGMQIDHLCRNRLCVNPDHLEVVTPGENTRRGFAPSARARHARTCPNGHEWTSENVYRTPAGWRQCRACKRERDRSRRAERIAA